MTTKEETGLINQHDAVEKDCKPTFKLIIGLCIVYYVLNISYFSHFTSNISGQQCMGLEAALA